MAKPVDEREEATVLPAVSEMLSDKPKGELVLRKHVDDSAARDKKRTRKFGIAEHRDLALFHEKALVVFQLTLFLLGMLGAALFIFLLIVEGNEPTRAMYTLMAISAVFGLAGRSALGGHEVPDDLQE